MAIRSNVDWPENLVVEIVLRLPVKSLLRFNCVSTKWYHLFKTSAFVSKHLSLSKRNTRRLLVRCVDANDSHNIIMRLFDDETLVPHPCLIPQLPHYYIGDKNFSFSVDNGLVCLLDRTNYRITLWNPATRKFRILLPQPQCDSKTTPKQLSFVGFGLDPISNGCKVITMHKDYKELNPRFCCHVYRMSTDSWRVMDKEKVYILNYIHSFPDGSINAFINGVCYWKVQILFRSNMLLAFHLRDETFKFIKLPPLTRSSSSSSSSWEELLPFPNDHGRLCFWSSIEEVAINSKRYEIWALNDIDAEAGHWTKLLTIGPPLFKVANIFKVWRESKLLVKSKEGKLLLWDIDANEFRDIGIQTNWWNLLQVYPYEETLLSIGRE